MPWLLVRSAGRRPGGQQAFFDDGSRYRSVGELPHSASTSQVRLERIDALLHDIRCQFFIGRKRQESRVIHVQYQ
jgi:hypothetical protein